MSEQRARTFEDRPAGPEQGPRQLGRTQVDADHGDLVLGGSGEERAPVPWTAAEDDDTKMPKMIPGRDLLRPDRGCDQLGRDHERVPPVPVAD